MSPTPETAKTPDETPIGNVDGDVDKYENLMLTPNGSIVAMIGDKELKPETDPDWEARQAERRARAKRKRKVFHSDAEHSDSGSIVGSAFELEVDEDSE